MYEVLSLAREITGRLRTYFGHGHPASADIAKLSAALEYIRVEIDVDNCYLNPDIQYLYDCPLRKEFEAYFNSHFDFPVDEEVPKYDGAYLTDFANLLWIGYHDRAAGENLKLRRTLNG
jgi:hypothetical protein